MPELPEVENIVADLRKKILTKKISKVHIRLNKIIKNKKAFFINKVKNSKIADIQRQGKFIVLYLSKKYYLVIHLKISGQLLYLPSNHPLDKYTHVIFEFKDSNNQLRYRDVRQFGYMKLINESELDNFLSSRIGPDYLNISYKEFSHRLNHKRKIIKSLLLDQKIFSGLGNIYVTESLYRAGIHPKTISSNIKRIKMKKLYDSIQAILRKAIQLGGSSISDYVRLDSSRGKYQQAHKVYQKEGERCKKCGAEISNVKINNRSSYFCPKCQKLQS